MGYVFLMGPCWSCGAIITYNPHRVPSVRVKDGRPDPAGKREPICRTCMEEANRRRVARGKSPHPINDDAYEAIEEAEL